MAPEWRRPDELPRLVEALRRTEGRPRRRWGELLDAMRRAQEQGSFTVGPPL